MDKFSGPEEGEEDDTVIFDASDSVKFDETDSAGRGNMLYLNAIQDYNDSEQFQDDEFVENLPDVEKNAHITDSNDMEYNFSHSKRGFAVIFNNVTFDPQLELTKRNGSDVDASKLYKSFKELEFDVKRFKNFTVNNIYKAIESYANKDHRDADCFVCIVLSHGKPKDVVYGYDNEILLEKLAEPFKKCKSLMGKPKIFVIQACRGELLDDGVTIVADGGTSLHRKSEVAENNIKVPSEADFLWVYATPPGYFAWRAATKGSWFIQSLVQAIDTYGNSKNFLHVLTYANYVCAHKFQSRHKEEKADKKKQSSNFTCRLTKDVYFRPKNVVV